jgi:hypothetical protein
MDLRKLTSVFEDEFEDLDEFLIKTGCVKEYNVLESQGLCENDILDILLDKYYNTATKFYMLLPIKDEAGYELYRIFQKEV